MLNLLRDHQVETEYPIGVVNWTKYVVFKCNHIVQRRILLT